MKTLVLIVLLCAAAFTCRADIDYSFSVENAPYIGSFAWEIQTTDFIQPPVPIFVNGECTNCDANYFTSFVSVSPPENGGGCQITKLWLDPSYSLTSFFSPLCAGGYDSVSAGVLPEPGLLGTWTWQGTNPDNTQNYVTLTISDPPTETPEPRAFWLLAFGMGLLIVRKLKF